jgi:hypothetical protein
MRLRITRKMLSRIVNILSLICKSQYEVRLFIAAYSLALHGFMRVGKLTVSNGTVQNHTIYLHNILLGESSLGVFIPSSKTDQYGISTTIS